MSKKIKNPDSGRMIIVGGRLYKSLLKQGKIRKDSIEKKEKILKIEEVEPEYHFEEEEEEEEEEIKEEEIKEEEIKEEEKEEEEKIIEKIIENLDEPPCDKEKEIDEWETNYMRNEACDIYEKISKFDIKSDKQKIINLIISSLI